MKKTGTIILLFGAFLGALFLPFANIGQSPGPPNLDRLLFLPTKYPIGDWDPPMLKFTDVSFSSSDGTMLHGWYCPVKGKAPTVLICHGNAGNVSTRIKLLQHLQATTKVNSFIFDYRGYGRSKGTPSVDGVLMDARAARIKIQELASVQSSDLILIGESIGGAIAVELAAIETPKALILQSTFSNLPDLAEIHYPRYVSSAPTEVFNSTATIAEYNGPFFQSHGTNDRIIPITLGRKLFDKATGDKTFLPISDAGHNDWQTPTYLSQLDRFIKRLIVD